MTNVIVIEDINNFVGMIPHDHDLICYEKGTDPMDGLVLYGFNEVGMFDSEFRSPAYAFCDLEWDGDFMNTATGSVDSYSNWRSDSTNWEGDIQAQLDSLVEVVKDTDGNWIRKNTMNKMTYKTPQS